MALDYAPFPLHYEHAQDGTVRMEIIGSVERVWFDATGIAFEGSLDRASPYFDKFVGELKRKELKTSSATAEHLADFDSEGRFVNWELVELTLTKTPSESRMPAVELVRSNAEQRTLEGAGDDSQSATDSVSIDNPITKDNPMDNETLADGMDVSSAVQSLIDQYGLDEVMAVLQQMSAGDTATMSATLSEEPGRSLNFKAVQDELARRKEKADAQAKIDALRADLDALKAQRQDAMAAAPETDTTRSVNNGGQASVSEPRKYWGQSAQDLLFAYQVLRSGGKAPSEELMRVMSARAVREIELHNPQFDNPAVRSEMPRNLRSDEVAISTAATGGDEWVGVAYSSNLWEKARNNRIYQDLVSKGMRVEEIPQGFESIYIPTEEADPTVYTVAQDADLDSNTGEPDVNIPITRIGTNRVQLTPGNLAMAVAFSYILEEDSLVPIASQYNRQMEEKAEETIEQLMFNGDTATSGNINLDGGSPSGTYYMASNGMIKYALVTGSGTSRNAGSLDDDDFRLLRGLMPSAIRARKDRLVYVLDSEVYNVALGIEAIKTDDVRRESSTLSSGVVDVTYGIPVLESGFILSADSDGKITSGGNVAETGRQLLVYPPFWAMGWKRRVMIETDRKALEQATVIVASFRVGFMPRGAGAAVINYNITTGV